MQITYNEYTAQNTIECQEKLSQAKRLLQEEYEKIETEFLDTNIKHVETTNELQKNAESWKLINKITGRKNSKRGQIKVNSKTERILKWYEHFKLRLGSEQEVETNRMEIKAIQESLLNIKTTPFTQEEYRKVK